MPDESSLHPPNEELEQRARRFAERARQLLEELHEEELHATASDITFKSMTALHNFLQSQSCYAELTRRRAIERAERDKQEAEDRANRDRGRENRHFWLEIGLTIVIIALIGWEIYEGRQQAALLHQMNKNTADTALQIQRAADATTASLEILRQERAERGKKPSLALYVGNLPIDKATVRLAGRPEYPQVTTSFDLLVKNVGDAPLSTSRLHALLPQEIGLDVERLITVPEFEAPARPRTQRVTLQLPLLPVGDTVRLHMIIYAPKGHPAFKIPFTLDASELQAVASLGSLTVLPLKP